MSVLALSLLVLAMVACVSSNSDRVTDLPGLHWKPTFNHYSGYLDATGGRKLHYWFIESSGDPSKDPVVLWLNGGPGCSSLDGLLSEHGPFLVADDALTLKENKYSWNKVASMLYLEAPAGVGFSYSADKQYKTDDDQVAKDNHAALQSFFRLYPKFKANKFYITGESYGGIYVPTLSVLVAGDSSINFKGFAVGNGLSSASMNDNSLIYFAYYHGLYSVSLWNRIVSSCCQGQRIDQCDFVHSSNTSCGAALGEFQADLSGLNIYNVYQECYPPSLKARSNSTDRTNALDLWFLKNIRNHKRSMFGEMYGETPPCVNVTALTDYLQRDDVRKALHVPSDLPAWEICSGVVGSQYVRIYENMTAQYQQLLASGKYHILVYNGDIDMACNYLGDEWFVDSLQQKMEAPWKSWFYRMEDGSQQVAGFHKQYKNIDFVTIKGAGHMVPTDKPIPALDMFSSFLQHSPPQRG